jgi:hypothetical protein
MEAAAKTATPERLSRATRNQCGAQGGRPTKTPKRFIAIS